MPITEVSFNVADSKNLKANFKVTNENIINSVFTNIKDNTLTIKQVQILEKLAKVSGEADVIEDTDINGYVALQSKIKDGNARRSKAGILSRLLGGAKGTIYVNMENGTKMKDIKRMFNLPDGSLTDYVTFFQRATGNRDEYEVDAGVVWFSVESFAKGNHLTPEQVVAMFE